MLREDLLERRNGDPLVDRLRFELPLKCDRSSEYGLKLREIQDQYSVVIFSLKETTKRGYKWVCLGRKC